MAGRIFEAGLQLLDRQLIDKDGKHAGKVDDLELEFPDGGRPLSLEELDAFLDRQRKRYAVDWK